MTLQRQVQIVLMAIGSLCLSAPRAEAATSVSGTYNSNVTWTLAGSPYIVEGWVTIGPTATLTIQPGVIVKFRGTNEALTIHGTLNAIGSGIPHITFTSIEDDAIGGDTGGDGPTQGVAGQWYNILINGTGNLVFVDVRYGGWGSANSAYGAIRVSAGATATLDYTTVRYSQRSGLTASSAVTISRSDFSWNANGISISQAPLALTLGSTVTNNSDTGIWLNYANYNGTPLSVTNSDITQNAVYGLRLQVSGGSSSSYPSGHENNIYGNGGGADARQISLLYKISAADWTNNYWGVILETVPCTWAPAGSFPYHLSYETPNPYSSPPKKGPVTYDTYSQIDPGTGQLVRCGADRVTDSPHAAAFINNSKWRSTCSDADPWDYVPDSDNLNGCLEQGGSVILVSGQPGYIIDETLSLTQAGTIITTPDGSYANFHPAPALIKRLLIADGVSNFHLHHLYFDGDKEERGLINCNSEPPQDPENFNNGKNLKLVGDGFTVYDVYSIEAYCGSAAEVGGSNFEISYSHFDDNGFVYPQSGCCWSDGLTIWGCNNGYVHNNYFQDNTDVDLIVGGGSNCTISNNTINHYWQHGIAGFMVGYFLGSGGDHPGGFYTGNVVASLPDMLSFGIMVGHHPWESPLNDPPSPPDHRVLNAGTVSGNRSTGAVVNLAVDGIDTGVIGGNTLSDATGTNGFGCSYSGNYTAAHYGTADIAGQAGTPYALAYDGPGECYSP